MIGAEEEMSGCRYFVEEFTAWTRRTPAWFQKRPSEFFPPEVVKGFSASERRALGDGIANALQIFELRSFKSIGNYKLEECLARENVTFIFKLYERCQ